jgi:hypothetical protein
MPAGTQPFEHPGFLASKVNSSPEKVSPPEVQLELDSGKVSPLFSSN